MSHGMIYLADGSTEQALTTNPVKMTGFTTNGPGSNSSGNLLIVPAAASDKITVKGGHAYRVDFHVHGSANINGEVQANVRVGGVEAVAGQCRASFGSDAETPSGGSYQLTANGMSLSCIIEPTADSDVEIYLQSGAGLYFKPEFAQLLVTKI